MWEQFTHNDNRRYSKELCTPNHHTSGKSSYRYTNNMIYISPYLQKKHMLPVIFWLVISGMQQRLFAFQPMPITSIVERKIQETGFHTSSLIRQTLAAKSNYHDTDEINPPPVIDRRSIIKATTSALLFTLSFTRGQEPSNAVPGLVHFPCNHPLMNTYHFMRSGESLLETEDLLATNPLFLTNREDALSPLGIEQVQDACKEMMARDINPSVVKYSLAAKSMDSADIVATEMQIGRNRLVPEYTFMDPRGIGKWDMQRLSTTEEAVWALDHTTSGKEGRGGLPPSHDDGTPNETLFNQVTRLRQLLSLLETNCSGDTILLVFPDGTGPALLSALIGGVPLNRVHELNFEPGEIRFDVTYSKVLQDMPSEPLPSYTAAIARGKTTLEQYESNPNQFLDLREEERLAEEELQRKLVQKEIDLQEKEILAQKKEQRRKLAQKELDLQEKEILVQKEEIRRKLVQKEIDLREKEILAQKEELRRKLEKKDADLREKILAQENFHRELVKKETLAKSIKREKALTKRIGTSSNEIRKNSEYEKNPDKEGEIIAGGGKKSHREKRLIVDDEHKAPEKLKKVIEAENMPTRKEFMVFKSKDKKIVAGKKISDDQLALDHNKKLETKVGSPPDSSVMALGIAGVMAAYKFAAGDIEGESENNVNYYPHSEQTSTKHNTAEAINQSSTVISDVHGARSITTATLTHDITASTPLSATNTGANYTLDLNDQSGKIASSGSETYLGHISKKHGAIEANNHNLTSEASELHETVSLMTAAAIPSDILDLDGNESKIDNFGSNIRIDEANTNLSSVKTEHDDSSSLAHDGLRKIENVTAASNVISDREQASSNLSVVQNSTFAMSPELQRMESFVVSAPFDVPELTDINEVEASKSEETERIDNANKAMEEYLSQDDGGSDWLDLMSDLMDS